MLDTELAAAKGGPILHIPLVLGAVTVAYHVKGVGRASTSTARRSARSSRAQITKWNDPAIKKLNPKANLPDEAIAVVHRSDGSGTTAVFTDFLTKTSPEWVAKLGGADKSFGKTVAWPVGIGGKGNDGVSALVARPKARSATPSSSTRSRSTAHVRQRQEQEGHVHHAVRRDDQRRGRQDILPGDLRTSLTWRGAALAYPITGTTFALVYQNQTDAGKAKALVNFLSWALTTGQNFPATVNYAPDGQDPSAEVAVAAQQDQAERPAAREDPDLVRG